MSQIKLVQYTVILMPMLFLSEHLLMEDLDQVSYAWKHGVLLGVELSVLLQPYFMKTVYLAPTKIVQTELSLLSFPDIVYMIVTILDNATKKYTI